MFGRRGTTQEKPIETKPAPAAPQPVAPLPSPESIPAAPDQDPIEGKISPVPEPALETTTPEDIPDAEIDNATPPADEKPKPKPQLQAKAKPNLIVEMSEMMAPATMNERLAEIKITVFNDLLEAVDLSEIIKLETEQVREEITDMVAEIISMRNMVLNINEQQQVVGDICNDILGLGPLEPLLERDDIADIMVNGPNDVYIETDGKIELTDIKFRDASQLMNICQRIVTAVGRRVDESSPIFLSY